MCGILGTIGFVDEKLFNLGAIEHRGPDGMRSWKSSEAEYPAHLGHTRLAILDTTEAADQPLISPCNRYVFVYNGEIYNFIELRKDLEARGHRFHSESDSEVFMTGLIEDGPSFQHRCNGMWAFCLWDRHTKSALFGRDRFGKKPLFISFRGALGLTFCSEMKGLYPFMQSVEPDESINLYLQHLFDYESTSQTVIKGITRIRPGHYATYAEGKLKEVRWWNTLDHLQEVPASYDDQVEKWRELFLDSVALRMRADVRIGTALSGGLDSSATFGAMAHLANENITRERQAADWRHGFCAHYPGSTIDESNWAELVTDWAGLRLTKVEVDPLSSGWSVMDALKQVEDPYLTLPTPMLATYKAISDAGIRVTLDGHGADEMFSGYGHLSYAYPDANSAQRSELGSIINSLSSGEYVHAKNLSITTRAKQRFIQEISSNAHLKSYVKALIGRADWDFVNYKLEFDDQNHFAYKNFDSLTKKLYEIFHISILPTLLRNYDRYSMASGVEIRMPFMDHNLVSFTFSLPWTSKVGGTYTKRIMRDALDGIVPSEIRERRDKIGWNAPLHEWLRGPMKNEIEALLSLDEQKGKVQSAWSKFQNKKTATFHDGQQVWALIMPLLWKKSVAGD